MTRAPLVLLTLPLLFTGAAAAGGPITSRAKYEAIRDPLVSSYQQIVIATTFKFPTVGGMFVIMTEANRLEAMNVFSTLELRVDLATANAINSHYTLNQRLALEASAQGARFLLDKLKADLRWYEERFPRFPFGTVNKADKREAAAFAVYDGIKKALERYEYEVEVDGVVEKKVLVQAEKAIEEKFKAAQTALLEVNVEASKAMLALSSLRKGVPLISQRMNEMNEVAFGLSHLADAFAAKGPKAQVLATISNNSPNLAFFVQVLRANPGTKPMPCDRTRAIPSCSIPTWSIPRRASQRYARTCRTSPTARAARARCACPWPPGTSSRCV